LTADEHEHNSAQPDNTALTAAAGHRDDHHDDDDDESMKMLMMSTDKQTHCWTETAVVAR